jgi:hypothetical protein
VLKSRDIDRYHKFRKSNNDLDEEDDYYHLYYNSKVWKRDQDEGGELEEDDSDEELLEEKSPSAVAFVVSIGARSDISFACPNIDSTKKNTTNLLENGVLESHSCSSNHHSYSIFEPLSFVNLPDNHLLICNIPTILLTSYNA